LSLLREGRGGRTGGTGKGGRRKEGREPTSKARGGERRESYFLALRGMDATAKVAGLATDEDCRRRGKWV